MARETNLIAKRDPCDSVKHKILVSTSDASTQHQYQQPVTSTSNQMTYFLENIAESLYKEFGNTLNRHCLVFPNRRAGLYFLKYLAARIEKPVWAPSILTINELFRSYSSLQIAGNEILLFELYKVYRNLKKPLKALMNFIIGAICF